MHQIRATVQGNRMVFDGVDDHFKIPYQATLNTAEYAMIMHVKKANGILQGPIGNGDFVEAVWGITCWRIMAPFGT